MKCAPYDDLQTRGYYERLDEMVRQQRKTLPARTQARFNPVKRARPAERNLPECHRRGGKERYDENLIPRFMCDETWLQDHQDQIQWTQDVPDNKIPTAFRAANAQVIGDELIDPALRE